MQEHTRHETEDKRKKKKRCLIDPRGLHTPLRGRRIILVLKQIFDIHASFDGPMDLHTNLTLFGYNAGTTEVDTTPLRISKRIQPG
jgi:hypothetical protein